MYTILYFAGMVYHTTLYFFCSVYILILSFPGYGMHTVGEGMVWYGIPYHTKSDTPPYQYQYAYFWGKYDMVWYAIPY